MVRCRPNANTNSPLDVLEGYHSVPFDPNLPLMKVSLSFNGSMLGSFAPQQAQDWVGIYDSALRATNTSDIVAVRPPFSWSIPFVSAFEHESGNGVNGGR
jgi:hypothetical protein